jgi:hypothetical protein
VQHRRHDRGVLERGLDDLHRQREVTEPVGGDPLAEPPREARAQELQRRRVEPHRGLEPEVLPHARLAADRLEDPLADTVDQPGVLGQRDELGGGDHPALGVVPAHERLDARRSTGVEPEDRLEVQRQLVARERGA